MGLRHLLLATCLMGLGSGLAGTAQAQDAAEGKAVFQAQCGICHSVQPGRNMVGPSLSDIVGRKSGQVAGFRYSSANKSSALTWDAATLDRYLASPAGVVPKSIMTYPGLKDDAKRAALIAYLASLP